MKKILSSLLVCGFIISAQAQWSPTKAKRNSQNEISVIGDTYKLDVTALRDQLKNAQEMGPNSHSVEISIPTLGGKLEKFAVYSFPVVVKELADQYQLGSYVGVSVQDPTKYVRFSLAPTDFQSMIINGNGTYEFIDPLLTDSSTFLVHPKTLNKGAKAFNCSTEESPVAINQLNQMLKAGKSFTNQPSNFAKNSDRKYRTMKLALSVTAEYTTFAGGTVAGALTKMNATMTRVNGVLEKDLALHLNIQNYPGIIYTNAATDPYSNATVGTDPANTNNANGWNIQLQQTLTANVGDANYDIGHLFGQSGGGGNAGCIGCVCIAPTGPTNKGKGSGYTSPSDGIPQGDTFDIDYVAHEMGHQLGGNHTFSHALEGASVNMEPGSGSTIMGYAGITGPDTDVQNNSDPYYHAITIVQVQSNLNNKTCDVEAPIANNIPVISALPTYTIPKGTAFVLSATVTDPENDPMTFTWEQVDNATVTIDKNNLGNTTSGASFRSVLPTTGGATRYFPRLSSVLAGTLNNSNNLWEAVPTVARNMQFALTVRDNSPSFNQQQTTNAVQNITVGAAGPFTVTSTTGSNNTSDPITWNVAGTAVAPYNAANVKIDYTTNGGATWTTLLASTPNDGTENVTFTGVANGTQVKLRVSAINNVFYAVNSVTVNAVTPCTGAAPTGLTANTITSTAANLSWGTVTGATYTVRYRKVGDPTWITVNTNTASYALSSLTPGTNYEYQVLAICNASSSPYSPSFNFTTVNVVYCTAAGVSSATYFINNMSLGTVVNPSGGATYTDYTTNSALQINLTKGLPYTITIGGSTLAANFASVFIDYNLDGTFDATERVLNFPVTNTAVFTGSITVPSSAVTNVPLRMRILFGFAGAANLGLVAPVAWVCGNTYYNGEVEDYNIVALNNLSTSDISENSSGIQIYPNPTSDILNITKVSDKANYEIYSVAGQILRKGTVKDGKIVVRDLITGYYILKITDKDVEKSFKFIKR